MRITLEADYAVRIICVLMGEGETVSARNISETAGVTLRFALKILRKLAADGIVSSQKGAAGGYRLALKPEELPLGRIIECIDGPFEISHCMDEEFDCSRVKDKAVCRMHHVFFDIGKKLRDEFYAVKMSDLK